MFLTYAVTAVFNSLRVRRRSRYTANFAAPVSAQRLAERTASIIQVKIFLIHWKFIYVRSASVCVTAFLHFFLYIC